MTIDNIKKWADDNKMKLNINKTKHMMVNQVEHGPIKFELSGNCLEQVNNYKYLGVILNYNMDYDEQWDKVSKTTNKQIYLFKQLRKMGFKEEILINVYQAFNLSLYSYSAPLLISTSRQANLEMQKQQKRFLNIIGISEERALKEYQIEPIEKYIQQKCSTIVEKILKDPNHPITTNVPQKGKVNTRSFKYQPNVAKTLKYQNSCLQQTLRLLRDGYTNKYSNPRRQEATTSEYIIQINKQKAPKRLQNKPHNKEKSLSNIKPTIETTHPLVCTICNNKYIYKTPATLKRHIDNCKKQQTTPLPINIPL